MTTSIRTPGYPAFIVACRWAAAALRLDPSTVLVTIQVILTAGMATYLLYDVVLMLGGSVLAAFIAASIIAGDADFQHFSSAVLTESLANTLAVVALWLRLRDGDWRRTAWVLAALFMTRPNLLVLPLGFALTDVVRTQRLRSAWPLLWPGLLVCVAWVVVCVASHADPLAPQRYFGPLHSFGKVYEGGLWTTLPPGRDRQLVAHAKEARLDVYQAAEAVAGGSSWENLQSIANAVIVRDPMAYARECLRVLPLEITQPSYWPEGPGDWPQRWAWIFYWRWLYRYPFYRFFVVFMVLLAAATHLGLGWPCARVPMRQVLAPFSVLVLVSVAALSLGSEGVGRVALVLHPINAILWGLLLARVVPRHSLT